MKRSKKFLSVILAVLMAFSSLTVGFYAIAAETAESGDAEEKSAVAELQDAITAFHNNKYNTLMFSAKEEEAEQKAEALKAFDELCAQLKALTDAEKLELNLSNYMYVLALITDKVGRDEGLSGNNAKIYGAITGYDKVVEKIGALPAEYQAAYDAVKALYVKVDGTLFNSSFDFKAKNAGYAHLETCLEQIKKLSPAGISFANYASPYGDGFYLYCSSPTGTASYIFSNIESNVFNYNQDKMTESGKSPSLSYTTFLERKRVDGVYVTTWKPGYDGAVYKASYEKHGEALQSDVTEPSIAAYERGTNPPTNNVYSPVRTIERAMMITILYRLAGEPYKDGNPHEKTPFTDITDTNAYYYDAACWALDKGITTETTFKPFNAVSREETAAFLFRYASENGLIYDENYKSVSINDYKDYSSIRPWAYEAMQWANFNGMITGTEQGYANPQGATQRVHASKILYGFGKNCDIGNFK